MCIEKKAPFGANSPTTSQKLPTQAWLKLPMLLLIVAIGIVLVAATALAESPTAATSDDAAPAVATLPPDSILLSPKSGGSIKNPMGSGGSLKYANEDIVRCTPVAGACNWDLYFDGSDVGLSSVNLLDLEILSNGHIIFAIDRKTTLPGIGQVKPQDVIEFAPTSLGTTTAGAFSFYQKGADVGLTTSGEAIDAVALAAGGKLVVSLTGSGSVPKTGGGTLSVKDEDLIQLDGTTWSLYLQGSKFKLTSSSEDVAAAWIDTKGSDHNVYVTTKGSFSAQSVNSRSGKNTEVLGITPNSSNPIDSGFLFRYFDAKSLGLTQGIDGLFSMPAKAVAQQAVVTSAADDSATAEDADDAANVSAADPNDGELDAYDQMDVQSTIFLPVAKAQ